jgi:hypothetical protein
MRRSACRTSARIATLLAALFATTPVRAEDFVAILWLRSPARDALLAQRVRGQLSDRPVRLIEHPEPSDDPSLGAELDAADRMARDNPARAVVWFASTGPNASQLLVIVAEPAGGRVLVRRVDAALPSALTGGAAGALDSATLETAALIVRTALEGLAAGAVIGLERKDVAPPPAPAPVAAPPALPSAPPAERARTAASSRHWGLSLGWRAMFDGEAIQQGLAARAHYAFSRLSIGFLATQSLGADLVDDYATLRVSMHTFGASFGVAALTTPELELWLNAASGVALFERSTEPRQAVVEATPARATPTWFGALEAQASWFPGWAGGFCGAWLSAGAEVVRSPTFGYSVGGEFLETRTPWLVRPTGGAGVTLRTP